MQHFPLMMPKASNSPEVIDVVAPFDGSTIATIDCASEGDIEQAKQTAYALYRDRKQWIPLARRIEILEKTVELVSQQKELLAKESAREGGKPYKDSLVEANRAVDCFKICIEHLRTHQGDVIPMGIGASSAHRMAFTQKEPIGVVVAVSAFNHPLNLIAHQVGAAVAAGCPVIVKPASDTPLSCMRLVRILHDAGLPPEWAQALLIKDNALATKLVVDERIGFFSFIGSAKVGWWLRSQLAPGTRCSLEHGGVAPAIVTQHADLEKALPLITKGGFYHSGQVCVSVQRLFVHDSIAKKLAKSLAKMASTLTIGDPTLETTDCGPIIRPTETDRVAEWVDEAKQAGAEVLCGGNKLSDSTYECTVLYDPPANCRVSEKEIFGPVVCVYPYKDLPEAIDRANSLPVSFQAAIFTDNLPEALMAYKNLDASAVMVNDHTAFRIDSMPFAGLRESGLGIGGIPYSIDDMQVDKMMVMQSDVIA